VSAFLRYTLSRLGLFLISAVLLGLVGLSGLNLALAALVVSAIASFFLLRQQRAALSARVAERVDRRHDPDQSPE
jgi:UPF0716 family protein affecting phage T7 exclusion